MFSILRNPKCTGTHLENEFIIWYINFGVAKFQARKMLPQNYNRVVKNITYHYRCAAQVCFHRNNKIKTWTMIIFFSVTWGNDCQISGPSSGPAPSIPTGGRLWSSGTTGRSEPQTPSHHCWGSYLRSSAEEKKVVEGLQFMTHLQSYKIKSKNKIKCNEEQCCIKHI